MPSAATVSKSRPGGAIGLEVTELSSVWITLYQPHSKLTGQMTDDYADFGFETIIKA